MKITIVRFPLIAYFLMAFLFSWLAVLPLIFNPTLPVEPFQIMGALTGPTLAALLVTAILDGRSGLVKLFKRYGQWRVGLVWWLIVLLGILIALNTVASAIIGIQMWREFFNKIGLILPTYAIALVAGVILGPLWEEPGWRGFALPRLQTQFGPILGTLILGFLWALWHIPGYLGGWMTVGILPLFVSGIAASILFTWVYNNTRGSILLMILLHSSSNAAISVGSQVLPVPLSDEMSAFVYSGWIPAITYVILAAIILIATRGKLSYDARRFSDPKTAS
ncbi:MAG: type II CAAX endopeptidase family protein [Caldilineaceae bacterium]